MPSYLPTVSSFVPSLPLGSPLKVSIHSWEAPIASPDTVMLAHQADWIWFEAHVLLDGFCVAYVPRLILRDGAIRLISNSEGSGSISKLAGLKSLVGQNTTLQIWLR